SGNILKNAMGVIIPHTNLRGVMASAILGVIGGDSTKKLEVLEALKSEHISEANCLLKSDYGSIEICDDSPKLYIEITGYKNKDYASVEIKYTHTNITKIVKNDITLYQNECEEELSPI